jgi:hypothetical protein
MQPPWLLLTLALTLANGSALAQQPEQRPRGDPENRQLLPAGLVQLRQLLRQEPLIAMGFRFRRSARLGPLRFNFAKGGLSSISVGGRGAAHDCGAAIPAGPAAGLPNSRRLRPGQLDALKQSLQAVLRQELFAAGSAGEKLWEHGLVSRLLADASIGARTTGLLALIETPEAMETYLLRAQGQDDA